MWHNPFTPKLARRSLEPSSGRLHVVVAGLTKQNYAELSEICAELKAEPFEVLAFPCNQFGKQEKGSPEQISNFVAGKLSDANYTLFEKVHVNGPHTHPVFHFCRYNAGGTRLGASRMRPIPWNFAKFLIDKEGRVVAFYNPKIPPSEILPDIKAVLAGTKQGSPSQRPTVGSDAPEGFLISR
eukprot:s451_g27.t1